VNLYRLDYESPNGELRAVRDRIVSSDYLSRHLSDARRYALDLANATGSVVRITKISGGGTLTPILRASGETGRIHRYRP
jgi:hypothetical protein